VVWEDQDGQGKVNGDEMKTIWKYPLEIINKQEIIIQKGYTPIHIGFDGDSQLCLWAIVDDNAKKTKCIIYVIATGHEAPSYKVKYFGTVKDERAYDKVHNKFGNFVFFWHIFIEK